MVFVFLIEADVLAGVLAGTFADFLAGASVGV
jgi:hypothetical protein